VAFYVYVFRLLQGEVEVMGDGGFFYFEFSLRILQVIRGMLQQGGPEIRRLLGDVLDEMIRFMSLVVASSEVLRGVTSEDGKKTAEIIYLLFVLYPLNREYILALVVSLSSADPQLVVSILTKHLQDAGGFQERADILEAICCVIDRFRRINFDEEIFQRVMGQDHQLLVTPQTLILTFRDQESTLFEVVEQLQQIEEQRRSEQTEDYYRLIYLLNVMRLLYGARSFVRDSLATTRSRLENPKSIAQWLSQFILRFQQLEVRSALLAFLQDFIIEICEQDFKNAHHKFILFDGEVLRIDTPLKDVLKLREGGTLEWLLSKEEFLDCLRGITHKDWEENLELVPTLQFLGKMVDLTSLFLTTYTFDVGFIIEV
jgi:hypothetical protein